jgi:HSP20 family molecular chaperone IbpA
MGSRWDQMQEWLARQQLPKGFEMMKEPEWVARIVKQMMEGALSGNPSAGLSGMQDTADKAKKTEDFKAAISSLGAQWSENKDYLLLKLPLQGEADVQTLRVRVKEERLRIDGLPGQRPHSMPLPAPVQPRSARAIIKEGVLRVRLKKKQPGKYVEVFIEEGPD